MVSPNGDLLNKLIRKCVLDFEDIVQGRKECNISH